MFIFLFQVEDSFQMFNRRIALITIYKEVKKENKKENSAKKYVFIDEGKKMKAEVIAVGTELLMGYVINTNTSYISQQLLDIGIGTYYQQVVGDNESRMLESFEIAANRSDIIILSGGIGPTRDDVTKQVLAEYLNQPLIHDRAQLDKVENHFSQQGRELSASDHHQALTFKNGETFFNEMGLACGTGYVRERPNLPNQYFIVLPGPPYEMEHMMAHKVKPYLEKTVHEKIVIESLYLNFYGVGEARLAQQLDDLIVAQENPTIAVYAQPRITTVRLTANDLTSENALQKNLTMSKTIMERLGNHFIGYGDAHSFETTIIELLKHKNQKLSVAESLTGGLVMESLTRVAGASEVIKGGVVTYQTALKESLLQVDHELIEEYSVVSAECAAAMAEQCLINCESDLALSLTGVAGPDSVDTHPVGEVYISLAIKGQATRTKALELGYRPRQIIRSMAKNEALNLLRHYLNE